MKKPEKFENRQLGSEKNADKKFTVVRRFFQNTYTHYNYYFNGNQKLNEIIENARLQNKDDYTKLLSFYSYSLDNTASSIELDSILQTATAGILLHDLRNDWIDNMYMIIGKAYLLRKDFDSAAMTFQYINYAFSPKEKDGYDKIIGSNAEEGGNAFSIATKEKQNIAQKVMSKPPSRNESFLWQVRTLIEKGEYLDASSLVQTLKNDPNFPSRLKEELAESESYLYYNTQQWDSAAHYLDQAIAIAPSIEEKARWYFLLGQLHQLGGNNKEASDAYKNCSKMALDPVMDVYARLNTIRLNKSEDPGIIDQNINDLLAMAKKDRYRNYRDIIYYAAALFEGERSGFAKAEEYAARSIELNNSNPEQRSRSFMLLGDTRYQQELFGKAGPAYDSTEASFIDEEDANRLLLRRPGTHEIYLAESIITLQDSLIQIAKMPEDERIAYVRQLEKKLRKARGLKEEAANVGSVAPGAKATADLFAKPSTTWYFYDMSRRTVGFNGFKERWGARPNADNWRRSSAIALVAQANAGPGNPSTPDVTAAGSQDTEKYDSSDISYDNLYSRLPLSEERMKRAEDRIISALYKKANALHEKLEEYPAAIKVYEEILARIDTGTIVEGTLFSLVHCYTMVGNTQAANMARAALAKNFPGNPLTKNTGSKAVETPETAKIAAATRTYQQIYDDFLAGNFDQALAAKEAADSAYGTNFWTPQLLYLESVYHIRQRDDSAAFKSLDNIASQFPDHPLAKKVAVFKDVLSRRAQIEEYLTKLDITRAKEDEIVVPTLPAPERKLSYAKRDSSFKPIQPKVEATKDAPTTKVDAPKEVKAVNDSIAPVQAKSVTIESPFTIEPNAAQMPAIVLENIDPAYVNEVAYSINSSPRRNFNGQPVQAVKRKLADKLWLIVFNGPGFTNAQAAIDYIRYIKPVNEKELLTWLNSSKYRYIMLSDDILSKLELEPNLSLYEKVLQQAYPDQFSPL